MMFNQFEESPTSIAEGDTNSSNGYAETTVHLDNEDLSVSCDLSPVYIETKRVEKKK